MGCKAPVANNETITEVASAKSELKSKPTIKTDMSEFFEKYPTIEIPIFLSWDTEDEGIKTMEKPFLKQDRPKICESGMVECKDDEQLFYAGKFELENGHIALITSLVGDFTEQLILTVHNKDEKMISSKVLNRLAEEEPSGYASYISKSFKISRSTMFYLPGTLTKEIDSEEQFQITSEGMIEEVK